MNVNISEAPSEPTEIIVKTANERLRERLRLRNEGYSIGQVTIEEVGYFARIERTIMKRNVQSNAYQKVFDKCLSYVDSSHQAAQPAMEYIVIKYEYDEDVLQVLSKSMNNLFSCSPTQRH